MSDLLITSLSIPLAFLSLSFSDLCPQPTIASDSRLDARPMFSELKYLTCVSVNKVSLKIQQFCLCLNLHLGPFSCTGPCWRNRNPRTRWWTLKMRGTITLKKESCWTWLVCGNSEAADKYQQSKLNRFRQ